MGIRKCWSNKSWDEWQNHKRKDVVCGGCDKTYTVLDHVSNVYTCETCRKENEKMSDMTVKQETVIEILEIHGIDYPTKEVVREYSELLEGRDEISERHVQRIRKWAKDNKIVKESTMEQQDVFDANEGMMDWEIECLNKANEGGWSLQQMSDLLSDSYHKNITVDNVKEALFKFKDMVSNQILDEDDERVYFDPKSDETNDETEAVLPEPKVNRSATNDDYWEVKIECVNACGKVEQSIDVFMNKEARKKAMMFMRWAKHREWLAYLVGEKKDDGYYVYDLYLPDQRTSATLVDKVVADKYNQMSIIGVIHSHHDMGAGEADHPSFSGHDTEFINSNHNLSLLAGNKSAKDGGGFKIVGIARVKTPCDAFMKIKANIKAMPEEPNEEEKALKDDFFNKVFNGRESSNSYGYDYGQGNGSYHFSNNPRVPYADRN